MTHQPSRAAFIPPLLYIVLFLTAVASAEPPRVVKASPDNGQNSVDPATRELRIVFDQPMDLRSGVSVVGGGPTFPKFLGKYRWIDDRTLVWAMTLEPNREYWLSINSDRFTNFLSAKGEIAVPYPIAFKTAARKPTTAPVRLTPEVNRQAIDELRRAIDQDYSYRDLRGLDWDKLFKDAEPKLLAAQTPMQFAREAGSLLAAAQDLHIWLDVDGQLVGSHSRRVPPNFNIVTVSQAVPKFQRRSSAVSSGRFDDGIGYILIATWESSRAKDIEGAYDALKELADAKALIIDVRANSGGDERLAGQFAGCFVDKTTPYARHVIRANGEFSQPVQRAFEPNRNRPPYRGKIAVLMGQYNMSSCESFLLMMKQAPGAKLVGQRSYGSSGNPQPVVLKTGVIAYLPCWKDLTLDGKPIEKEGIAPDIDVPAEPKDFLTADPVLQAALKTLRN